MAVDDLVTRCIGWCHGGNKKCHIIQNSIVWSAKTLAKHENEWHAPQSNRVGGRKRGASESTSEGWGEWDWWWRWDGYQEDPTLFTFILRTGELPMKRRRGRKGENLRWFIAYALSLNRGGDDDQHQFYIVPLQSIAPIHKSLHSQCFFVWE